MPIKGEKSLICFVLPLWFDFYCTPEYACMFGTLYHKLWSFMQHLKKHIDTTNTSQHDSEKKGLVFDALRKQQEKKNGCTSVLKSI